MLAGAGGVEAAGAGVVTAGVGAEVDAESLDVAAGELSDVAFAAGAAVAFVLRLSVL